MSISCLNSQTSIAVQTAALRWNCADAANYHRPAGWRAVSAPSVDEIERIVAAALTGDRRAESRMLTALRPGVLAVLRFGAFHRWMDAEDLTQETLHIVVERVRARTIDDPRKVFAFAAATARNLALNAARKMLRQQTVVDSELVDELAQNVEMEQIDLSESDDRQLAQAVAALLEELPTERDRQLLMRFYLDGLTSSSLPGARAFP